MSNNRKGGIVPKIDILARPKATRHNEGKLKWSLIDYKSMEPLIRIMEKGVEEYGLDNWKIGLDLVEIQESAQRHLAAMMNGELKDSKSLELHAGHVMANMMMWMYHYNKQQESK